MKAVRPGANIAHAAVLIDVPENASPDDMLLPKPTRDRTPFIPVLPQAELSWAVGHLMPEVRKAMAHICENASILEVKDVEHTYLIVPVTDTVLDTLAAFGADGEDREVEHDDEIEEDGNAWDDKEPDVDEEPDYRIPNPHIKPVSWGTCPLLTYKLRRDVPGTDMKVGDTIFADSKPGWSGKGVYMMRIDLGPSEGWRTVAVGHIDPLTKKGELRKSLVIGGIRFALEGGGYRAHRVESRIRPI